MWTQVHRAKRRVMPGARAAFAAALGLLVCDAITARAQSGIARAAVQSPTTTTALDRTIALHLHRVPLREALTIFEEQNMEADIVEVLLRLGEVEATRENWPRVREQLTDLDRRRLSELRPDLTYDMEQLRARLPG